MSLANVTGHRRRQACAPPTANPSVVAPNNASPSAVIPGKNLRSPSCSFVCYGVTVTVIIISVQRAIVGASAKHVRARLHKRHTRSAYRAAEPVAATGAGEFPPARLFGSSPAEDRTKPSRPAIDEPREVEAVGLADGDARRRVVGWIAVLASKRCDRIAGIGRLRVCALSAASLWTALPPRPAGPPGAPAPPGRPDRRGGERRRR